MGTLFIADDPLEMKVGSSVIESGIAWRVQGPGFDP